MKQREENLRLNVNLNQVHDFITPKFKNHSHLTFTCSKSTIETLEKGVKYVQRF